MKYRILMYPSSRSDTRLDDTEYETLDEAVKNAIAYVTDDFVIVQVINWKAEEVK